jgi:hypothetical protein
MWWVTAQKNGASALGLQRVLGLKKYETAWTLLHKLRRAMVRPGRDLLTGRVEVDECYIGGLEEGLPGRLNLQKALIVVAAQEDGPGIGRIRMRHIVDADMPPSSEQIIGFLQGIQRLLVLIGQKKALGIAVHNDRPQRRYSGLLSRLRFVSYQKSSSGFFQQARNPDQNYRAHKRDNDGTYHAAARPDSQKSKDPTTHNAAEDSENDVHQHAVATTLHNLTRKPTCYQSNHNPSDESHADPPCRRFGSEFPQDPTENIALAPQSEMLHANSRRNIAISLTIRF